MLTRSLKCPGCGKLYPPPAGLAPGSAVTVRCPACGKRFRVRRAPAEPPPATPPPAPPRVEEAPVAPRPAPPAPPARAEGAGQTDPAAPEAAPARPAADAESARLARRRARRLARALVHDLVQGRIAERDRALAEGRLLLEFGEGIRAAWIAYQEKLGREFAQETPYFRDALNEILADGRPLF